MLHTATYLTMLQKSRRLKSTSPATRNVIFHCKTACEKGVLQAQFRPQLALACNSVALQVAEKNATYKSTLRKRLVRHS